LGIIRAIVVVPLAEGGNHPLFANGAAETQLVTPFDKVRLAEDVPVVRSAPDEDPRNDADWIVRPIDQCLHTGHFDIVSRFDSFRRNEELLRAGPVRIIGRSGSLDETPINLERQAFRRSVAAVLPSWLGRESRDVDSRVLPVSFGQPFIARGIAIQRGSQFDIEPVDENERALYFGQRAFGDFGGSIISAPEQDGRPDEKSVKQNEEPVGDFIFGLLNSFYTAALLGVGLGALIGWGLTR